MKLSELCRQSGITEYQLQGDAEVHRLVMDSRKIKPGDLFVAMPSASTDSHQFIAGAIAEGAVGAIVHQPHALEFSPAALYLENYEENLWKLCKTLYDNPAGAMKVIGITGTNGKTTTAWILRDMLQASGLSTAYLGTLGFQYPGKSVELSNTTPFVVDLYNLIAEARDAGVEAIAMEVSSHALAQKRVEGIEFDVVLFTNFTQDHLDFHGSLEKYMAAKWRLFSDFRPAVACFNIDDESLQNLPGSFEGESIRYTSQAGKDAELIGNRIAVTLQGIELQLITPEQTVLASSKLAGNYNVSNLIAACSIMLGLGYSLDKIAQLVPNATPVPGRFETIPNSLGKGVIVDYAHTPDAVEKLLDAVRPLTKNRIITVFGCGGDRDAKKRPLMAKAASERSDLTVLTSDNPRTEDPKAILEQVAIGIQPGKASVQIEDRIEAIRFAVSQAKEGDTVVIAGKGHENYQIIGKQKFHMDDREIAQEALSAS